MLVSLACICFEMLVIAALVSIVRLKTDLTQAIQSIAKAEGADRNMYSKSVAKIRRKLVSSSCLEFYSVAVSFSANGRRRTAEPSRVPTKCWGSH